MSEFDDEWLAVIERCYAAGDWRMAPSNAIPRLIAEVRRLREEYPPDEWHTMRLALRNVLALSHRLRKTDPMNADHLARFCASAGVVPTFMRGIVEPPT